MSLLLSPSNEGGAENSPLQLAIAMRPNLDFMTVGQRQNVN